MLTNEVIKTGMLAYGMSGKVFHAPFLENHAGFKLVAVVERNKKIAQLDYPNIQSYNSIEDLLNDASIDLVVINTPNYLHFEHAKQALLAGKHILVEKPFTATVAEAKMLFDLGKKLNLKVLVYQNRRYSSDFIATKKIIESGVLGEIIEINLRFDRYRATIGPKAFKESPFPASGIVYDLGAHLLDQVISIYGKPISFNKSTEIYRENGTVPDYGFIHLKYPNKIHAFITVSLLTANPQKAIVVNGTKGSFVKSFSDVQEEQSLQGMNPLHSKFGIENPHMEGVLTNFDADGNKISQKIPSEKGNMMGIFNAVFETITQNKDFPISESEIITQLEILETK